MGGSCSFTHAWDLEKKNSVCNQQMTLEASVLKVNFYDQKHLSLAKKVDLDEVE